MDKVDPTFTVKVKGGKTYFLISLFRAAIAVPILILSLVLYGAGVLLTVTVIGAVIGIPIIITTYVIDIFALAMLINIREKIYLVTCPACQKRRVILHSMTSRFACKRCKSHINIEKI